MGGVVPISGFQQVFRYLFEYVNILTFGDLVKAIIDIGIVAYIIYKLVQLIKETRAWQLVKGVIMILIATWVANIIGLQTISFVLNNTIQLMAFALIVLFQTELRKGLEKLGTSKFRSLLNMDTVRNEEEYINVLEEIADSAVYMSARRIGALIVIEKQIKLGEVIHTGTPLDSQVSAELLEQIFIPNTPLHDGAVVIRGDRIVAASCFLPLSTNGTISKELGTRHRAAIGITEVSDCLVIIVSEETGKISVAKAGSIVRNYDKDSLVKVLKNYFITVEEPKKKPLFFGRRKNH